MRRAVLALLCVVLVAISGDPDLRAGLTDERRRDACDALEIAAGTERIASSPDGRFTAVAGPQRLLLVTLDETAAPLPEPIDVGGTIRALAWSGFEDSRLWIVRHRPARRGPGETALLRVETDRGRARRELRLPATTRAIGWWPLEDSLLIAADDTIRSIRLDGLRSGTMFRFASPVETLAAVGGSRILISHSQRLGLVDLWDTPGPESMPLIAEHPLSLPLVTLAAGDDWATAVATDGSRLRIRLDPLRVSVLEGHGPLDVTPIESAAAMRPSRVPRGFTAPAPPAPARPLSIVTDPRAPQPPATEPESSPPVRDSPPTPAPGTAAPLASAPLSGRVLGPAAAEVVAVVLLGPDNLLREAARVRPDVEGRWVAPSLPPGRYRVQLAAAGGATLLTDPPYAVVRLAADPDTTVVVELRALRRL